ncbi:hypothetical protein [Alkaliphilus peptidifermentans]|uniref:hypothetical protein n=1 Tax=Alkaliphilus peptidifermentans TaxID=426129 RepID=UPI000AD369AF|nr:hypothetical protein [Alkaliphilus peptidifermentans]
MSFVTKPAMLIVGFVFLRLFGQGSMTLIPSTLVPQWFINYRGKALSLMALGGVAGSALLPPINNWLINNMGVGFDLCGLRLSQYRCAMAQLFR